MSRVSSSSRGRAVAVAVLVLGLVASACGGKSLDEVGQTESLQDLGLTAENGESGLEDAGDPQRGGKLTYGLEADSTNGYCLPEGQLAISGMMVVRAVYDTLTVPNGDGGYSPYLAESVEPNDDYTEWDIVLRPGIEFHDGSPLDAEVVKNNLNAYRGAYVDDEGNLIRNPLLFIFVLQDIESVEVVDELTVRVSTKRPWVAFPAFLYSSSRLGMMAQAQLDDQKSCDRKLIGTGPFEFVSWDPGTNLVTRRNPDYWQIAPDGEPYPYVDELEFRAMPEVDTRINALESGEVNMIHTSSAGNIGGRLLDLRDAGLINLTVSEASAEVTFLQLNHTKPPFDDIRMRRALALGSDRDSLNRDQNDGIPTLADGPFAPDSIGYVEDPGFPQYDLEAAKALVREYEEETGRPAAFNLSATTDPEVITLAQIIQERAKQIGVDVKIVEREQAALIDDAISKNYEVMTFRNYPGGDPDTLYVWWYGKGNPVNFGGWEDPVVNDLLDRGRSETDPEARAKIYQDLDRRMAEEVHSIWSWYTPWAIATSENVHGVYGPPLPGEDASEPAPESTDDPTRQPSLGLATGHSLIGLWVTD